MVPCCCYLHRAEVEEIFGTVWRPFFPLPPNAGFVCRGVTSVGAYFVGFLAMLLTQVFFFFFVDFLLFVFFFHSKDQ